MTIDLLSLTPEAARSALADWLSARGEPAYRIRQILPRLWQRPVGRWSDATDLPAPLRTALDAALPLQRLTLRTHQVSSDGTVKFLWALADGEAIESVLIPEGKRRTLCISSQAGCALGCVFCAAGRMGFRRNLSAGEIAGQVREMVLRDPAQQPTNVVFMGMGEPLLNWDAVDTTLTILNQPEGFGIGARHITVSTVGILPNLAKFAKRGEQFRLAVSLHAPSPALRRELMPIEKKYTLPELTAALKQFRRRVTLEYAGTDARLRAASEAARRRGCVAAEPRPRHQRGLRSATGGSRRSASRPPPPGAESRRRGARSHRVSARCRAEPRCAPPPAPRARARPLSRDRGGR
ncbi:MAG: hypothetical protein AUI08_02500 [Gemmatimonadetes bacterium 13_2_20CM_2_65_7]|nr:MAG: hypothetical protein AUI08_02500 [Gemmatimonadetes bacterium 13_2_20CM_2_65_7]